MALVAFLVMGVGCGGGGGKTPAGSQPAVTDAGTPNGNPTSKSIGPSGGALTSSDGRFTLTVPPGAVAADTTFTIQPITSPLPNAVGASYRLSPEGATFDPPVSLTFEVPEAGVSRTSVSGLGVAYREPGGTWRWLTGTTRDAAAGTVAATTGHFTDFSAVEGLQLKPLATEVAVGGTVALQAVSCFAENPDTSVLAPLVYECQPVGALQTVFTGWAVNGVAGGDSTHGSIAPESNTNATFTAPGEAPTPATVAVSVEAIALPLSPEKVLLVSEITILPGALPCTLTLSGGLNASLPCTATYSRDPNTGGYLTFGPPTGNAPYGGGTLFWAAGAPVAGTYTFSDVDTASFAANDSGTDIWTAGVGPDKGGSMSFTVTEATATHIRGSLTATLDAAVTNSNKTPVTMTAEFP